MPKEEWGVKRLCPHCASRFFDLKRNPMTCPECGESFTVESLTANRGRPLIAEKAEPKEAEVVDDLPDDEIDDDSGELDDDLLEDDEDDNVSLDDIADVSGDDDET